MTIAASGLNGDRYIGDGINPNFIGHFRITAVSEAIVLADDVAQVYGTQFTITGVGNPTFTVAFHVAPASLVAITILRNQPIAQGSVYLINEAYQPIKVMVDLENATKVDQMLAERIGRAPRFAPNSIYADVSVDDPVASQMLRWKSDLSGIESTPVSTFAAGSVVATLTAERVTFASGPAHINTDGALLWDNTNKRLGVGVVPQFSIDVARITSTDMTLEWGIRSVLTINPGYTPTSINEKAAIYAQGVTKNDHALADVVGIVSQGYIAGGILTGRAWGMLAGAVIDPNLPNDGQLIGLEIDVNNFGGTVQDLIDTNTSKYGIWLATGADGVNKKRATVGIGFANDTPGVMSWFYGIYMRAIGGEYIHMQAPPTAGAYGLLMENSANWAEAIRIPNNVPIFSRNAANNGNVQLISAGPSNDVAIGDAAHAMFVQGTEIKWGRPVISLGGGAGATLGSIGGTGPTTAAQTAWLKFISSTDVACYVPVWI